MQRMYGSVKARRSEASLRATINLNDGLATHGSPIRSWPVAIIGDSFPDCTTGHHVLLSK